jgi:hypothetical protein
MDTIFRLWNPKTKQWARAHIHPANPARLDYTESKHHIVTVVREGAVFDGWSYDGQATGAIFWYDPEHDEPFMRVSARDDTKPLGQGWGLTMYLAAAIAAGCIPRCRGIYSDPEHRSPYATRLWETMLRHGIATPEDWDGDRHRKNVIYAKAARALYKGVDGVKLTCK